VRAGDLFRRIDRRLLPVLVDAANGVAQRPVRPRLLIGVAVMSVAAVLGTAVWAAEGDQGRAIVAVDDIVQVGVAEGESVPDYLQATRNELSMLSTRPAPPSPAGESYALVTFSEYLPPGRLAPVLSGVSVEEVYLRVPLGRTPTQVIRIPAFRLPEDVLTGMDQAAQRKTREATDYRRRVAELGRAAELDLWKAYDEGARVASAEAEAYRRYCACVYAAVVRGAPADLRELATQFEIRAVDPAPEVRRLDRAVFLPPLPEYDEVVPVGDAALISAGPPLSVHPDPAARTAGTDNVVSGDDAPGQLSPDDPEPGDASLDAVEPGDVPGGAIEPGQVSPGGGSTDNGPASVLPSGAGGSPPGGATGPATVPPGGAGPPTAGPGCSTGAGGGCPTNQASAGPNADG
jgi:hypothetical protein